MATTPFYKVSIHHPLSSIVLGCSIQAQPDLEPSSVNLQCVWKSVWGHTTEITPSYSENRISVTYRKFCFYGSDCILLVSLPLSDSIKWWIHVIKSEFSSRVGHRILEVNTSALYSGNSGFGLFRSCCFAIRCLGCCSWLLCGWYDTCFLVNS